MPAKTHGMRKSSEYTAWLNMRSRCCNPKTRGYSRYGGQGVRVCPRWIDSFENFLADMGKKPSPKHSLDRYPVSNGDYEPSNCRWATDKEQSENRSITRWIKYRGKVKTLTAWARVMKIPLPTLFNRLKAGWSVERAMSEEANNQDILITHDGKTLPICEWAKIVGIKKHTISTRLKRGWSPSATLTQKPHRGVRCPARS